MVPLLKATVLIECQCKDTLRHLQISPLEYMNEVNNELRELIATAGSLKKTVARPPP